jgi:hypothetical protein
MRAVGCYVSNADVRALNAHARFLAKLQPGDGDDSFAAADDDGICSSGAEAAGGQLQAPTTQQHQLCDNHSTIDWPTLLCLYANHRPVSHVGLQQLEDALAALGVDALGVAVRASGWRCSQMHMHAANCYMLCHDARGCAPLRRWIVNTPNARRTAKWW